MHVGICVHICMCVHTRKYPIEKIDLCDRRRRALLHSNVSMSTRWCARDVTLFGCLHAETVLFVLNGRLRARTSALLYLNNKQQTQTVLQRTDNGRQFYRIFRSRRHMSRALRMHRVAEKRDGGVRRSFLIPQLL